MKFFNNFRNLNLTSLTWAFTTVVFLEDLDVQLVIDILYQEEIPTTFVYHYTLVKDVAYQSRLVDLSVLLLLHQEVVIVHPVTEYQCQDVILINCVILCGQIIHVELGRLNILTYNL